ncbi:cytochrome c oxidase assembly protein [Leucobacter sp. UT-8R-CII-1-4]|uniref:cytochrome c oxidase assembly protein n=1 Tax=Micrococcales TaxID=85006 RepID=UPI002162345D|nr:MULTISPECIES: cytochrome c oxidase assembly protein [Micrococcales]MDI6024125.1 cytochrome c oxidase assembly protein [Leucobacter sp. UT-8R-CII-1-4]
MTAVTSIQPDEARANDPVIVKRRSGVVRALVALGAGLVLVPAPLVTILGGQAPYDLLRRSFPGLDVGVLTAVGQAAADAAAVVTVGALLTLLFFRDARGRNADLLRSPLELKVLQISSGFWASAAGAMVLFTMLDSNGQPFARLGTSSALSVLYEASSFPKAWTVTLLAALVVFFFSMVVEKWTGLLIPLWAACFGVLAPVVVGQILVGPEHDFGSDAGVYQSLLTSAVFGVVLLAAIRVASGRLVAPDVLPRMFLFLVFALPAIVGADVLLAWFKLAGTGLLDSVTGWQIITRWIFLALICGLTMYSWHIWRRRRINEQRLVRVLGGMAVAITGWVGVTAAMTRFPPPHYFVPTSISQVFLGFEVAEAPTPLVLFTHWRPNILFLLLAAAAVTVYLIAVNTLRRRGDAWPAGRTVAWLSGWIVVVFVTSSGFGKYSAPDFGIHMIVHMSLNMLAPILLVMGGIVTLLLRSTKSNPQLPAGIHDWVTWALHWRVLRFIYNPLIVFALFVGSYYGLYFSGIFGEYMRFHWAHQLMNVHFLIAGYLFYGLVIGVDRPPRPLPHIGKLGFVLAAMPFHAFFGVILMSGGDIIAENFYRYLDLPWADLKASQYLGGGVAWAGGEIPLLLVIIALGVQWSRQDAKDARRKDRHLDAGLDDEFDDYNRMLEKLSARQARNVRGPQLPGTKEGTSS